MSIIADCHLHSYHSGDSDTPMEAMIVKAIELGLKEICFTEHQDIDYIYKEGEVPGCFEINTDSYLYELIGYKEKYRTQIEVSFGVELGMQSHIARKLAAYSKNHDFDFIIASSHLCNQKDPYFPDFFEGRSESDAYHEYFRYINECLRSFLNFDVYGHLDYVLRYGPNKNADFVYTDYKEDIDQILQTLIENEKGIEVNSSGIAYGLGQPHPCKAILQRYKELGGEIITIGSDAHEPSRIAYGYAQVEELLATLGYKYYCVFKGRLPEYFRL